jgi:hypothetical protein
MSGMIEQRSRFEIERPNGCEWLARQEERTFAVDLTLVHLAEARREELVAASGRSLLELANAFDDGYDSACKLHSKVIYESEMATIASRKRRAVLLRDEFPDIIKKRGLGSTKSPVGAADIRDSLMYEDAEFVSLEQYRAALECIKELLFGKMLSMQRMCKRAEVLLQRRDAHSNGLGEHDPDGRRLEQTMKSLTEEREGRATITAISPRRGFASKERD